MRVVFVSVFDDGFGAFVGVAVFAEVRAGGVGAYVISEETGAALSCLVGFDVWDFQFEVEGFFQLFFCHAAACVYAYFCKARVFQAGGDVDAVLLSYLCHSFCHAVLDFVADSFCFGEVPDGFLVEVDEGNDAGFCAAFEFFCHVSECTDVAFGCEGFGEEDRIVPPDGSFFSYFP